LDLGKARIFFLVSSRKETLSSPSLVVPYWLYLVVRRPVVNTR